MTPELNRKNNYKTGIVTEELHDANYLGDRYSVISRKSSFNSYRAVERLNRGRFRARLLGIESPNLLFEHPLRGTIHLEITA